MKGYVINYVKKVWHEIFEIKLFKKSVFPGPQSIPLGPFQNSLRSSKGKVPEINEKQIETGSQEEHFCWECC